MVSPTSTGDIEVRWRTLTAPETTVATTRLEDAWRKLKRLVPGIADRLGAGEPDLAENVDQLLADAVIRVMQALERNGNRSGTVTIDDSTRSWVADDTVRTDLYFTDAEIASVAPAADERRPRAFSLIPS